MKQLTASAKLPFQIWSDDLTDKQLAMIFESGEGTDADDTVGFGVELRAGAWATARSLAGKGLGSIAGDPGGSLPGMFFANEEGVRIAHEFDNEPDEEDAFDEAFEAVAVSPWLGFARP